jgi:hypothetical protein
MELKNVEYRQTENHFSGATVTCMHKKTSDLMSQNRSKGNDGAVN